MPKLFKAMLWATAALAVVLILALVAAKFYFSKEKVLAIVLPPIEERIDRPVTIEDAGISLWGGVGVFIAGVRVGNPRGFDDSAVLTVGTIDVKARFWPLFLGRVEIDRIEIDAPALAVMIDSTGRSNIDDLIGREPTDRPAPSGIRRDRPRVAAPDESRPRVAVNRPAPIRQQPDTAAPVVPETTVVAADTAAVADVRSPVTFERILLSDGRIALHDAQEEREAVVEGVSLRVEFDGSEADPFGAFRVDVEAAGGVYRDEESELALDGLLPRVHALLSLHDGRSRLSVDSASVVAANVAVGLTGSIGLGDVTRVDLALEMAPIELAQVVDAVPAMFLGDETRGMIAALSPSGTVSGTGRVVDDGSGDGEMGWTADVTVASLDVGVPEIDARCTIERLELQGEGDVVTLHTQNGRLAGRPLSVRVEVSRLSDPRYEATVRSSVDLAMLAPMIAGDAGAGTATTVAGMVGFNFTGVGAVEDWRAMRLTGGVTGSAIAVSGSGMSLPVEDVAFRIGIDGNTTTIEHLAGVYGRSDFALTGRVEGLTALALAEDFDAPTPELTFALHSDRLDLDEVVGEDEPATAAGGSAGGVSEEVVVPLPPLVATGTVTADSVFWSGAVFSDLNADSRFADMTLVLDPAHATVYDGRADGTVIWDIADWERPVFDMRTTARQVDVSALLAGFAPWAAGLSERLFGKIDLEMELSGAGDEAAEILTSLAGKGTARLKEGRLNDVALFSELSKVLGGAGFESPVNLRDLATRFHFADGRLVTDALSLSTREGDFQATGSFGFDGTLDYDIAWDLSEDALRKLGDVASVLSLLDDQRNETPTVRMHLGGSALDPKLQLDTRDVGRNLLQQLLDTQKDSTGGEKGLGGFLKDLLKKNK